MFIGHFGLGFAVKTLSPRVSLGTLFIAVQFIDLIWPTLLLLDIERVTISPGATAVTPLIFEYYPFSHSLLAVLIWAFLVGVIYFLIQRNYKGAYVLGVLVISHWVLDAIVHQPDLPLYPDSNVLVGLNAWSSLPVTLAIEVPLFALGIWLYARSTKAINRSGRWGFWGLVMFLLLIYAANLFGEPPPSTEAIAWVGQLQWILVLWGYWIDRQRRTLFSTDIDP